MLLYFPMKLIDLDDMTMAQLDTNEGLNTDHPGFIDPEYVKRRNEIGQKSKNYKITNDIPNVEYTDTENNTWKLLYEKLRALNFKHLNKEYIDNFILLEKTGIFSSRKIPQLNDINKFLNKRCNWPIKSAGGFLNQPEYLNCLVFVLSHPHNLLDIMPGLFTARTRSHS